MAFLFQIMLPLYGNDGRPFGPAEFVRVRRELTDRFGGVTGHTRAPAEGFWEDSEGRTQADDVVIVEVMAELIDRAWWSAYARELASWFAQEEIVIRVITFERLTGVPPARQG